MYRYVSIHLTLINQNSRSTGSHSKSDTFRATEPCSSTELCNYIAVFMINRTHFVLLAYQVYWDIPVYSCSLCKINLTQYVHTCTHNVHRVLHGDKHKVGYATGSRAIMRRSQQNTHTSSGILVFWQAVAMRMAAKCAVVRAGRYYEAGIDSYTPLMVAWHRSEHIW